MKKILLSIVAVALACSVNAQQLNAFQAPVGAAQKQSVLAPVTTPKFAAPRRANLPSNQKIMGNYTSDELPTAQEAYSLGSAGTYPAATYIGSNVTSDFVGGKVVAIRFAVANSIGASRVFITPVTSQGIGNDVVSVDVASTQPGWNTVELPTPYEIDGTTEFLLGFDYVQVSGAYSFWFVGNEIDGGAYIYGLFNSTYGIGWYNFSNYGQVAVQAIVESDNYPAKDIVLSDVSVSPFVKGGNIEYAISAYNFGTENITNYSLLLQVDGQTVKTLNSPVELGTDMVSITGSVQVGNLALGKHVFTVVADKVDGAAPTANTSNDQTATNFIAYNDEKAHDKYLVEHFTSSSCTYCPLGYSILEKLTALRPDVEWVSLHDTQNSNYPDPYKLDACVEIEQFLGLSGWPGAAFNRLYDDEDKAIIIGLGYNTSYHDQVAAYFSEWLNEASMPAFVSLKLDATFDAATREATLTVNGEGVEGAATLLANDNITVYVVEDGLVSRQLNQGTWVTKFDHRNVLRNVLTAAKGDAITWNGDNFTAKFTTTIDSEWDAEKVRFVALVAGNPDAVQTVNDYAVNNANSIALPLPTVAVKSVEATRGAVAEYFTLDGRQVAAPAKGVNLVRMADGRTVKVVVK